MHRKLIDIGLVDDLFSSPIIYAWEKIEPLVKERRKRLKRPQIREWFEYLTVKCRKESKDCNKYNTKPLVQ